MRYVYTRFFGGAPRQRVLWNGTEEELADFRRLRRNGAQAKRRAIARAERLVGACHENPDGEQDAVRAIGDASLLLDSGERPHLVVPLLKAAPRSVFWRGLLQVWSSFDHLGHYRLAGRVL